MSVSESKVLHNTLTDSDVFFHTIGLCQLFFCHGVGIALQNV